MELAILSIIIVCFLVSCIIDCICPLICGIVFLILMSVYLFMIGYLSKNTVILITLAMVIYLICIFLCIWILDSWYVFCLK